MPPFANGLLIGFITEGIPFHGNTLEESSLGGSETALICMARELARRGNEVHVFCKCPKPGLVDVGKSEEGGEQLAVAYYDLSQWPTLAGVLDFDVLIVSRFYAYLEAKFKARLKVLWNHDVIGNPGDLLGKLWQTDLVFCLSQYHVKNYLTTAPDLKPLMQQTRNGVDWEWLSQYHDTPKVPGKFLYSSRPERGLETLVSKIFPLIVKEIPEAKLYVCGYDVVPSMLPEEIQSYYKSLNDLLDAQPWVVKLGSLKKDDYYRELASSQMLLYPTSFPEISCITAMEAQGVGTLIMTTDDFALKETVGPKTCLVPPGPNFEQRFAQRVIGAVRDQRSYDRIVKHGKEWIKARFQWKDVAEEWEQLFYDTFETRFQTNRENVCRRLMYNSDYVLARQVAEQEGLPEILQELDALTIGGVECYVPEPIEWDGMEQTYTMNPRWRWVVAQLKERFGDQPFTFLDLGCGMGTLPVFVSNTFPHAKCIGLDWSETYIEWANRFKAKHAKAPENIEFRVADFLGEDFTLPEFWKMPTDTVTSPYRTKQVDALFMGEVLEHHADYQATLTRVESLVRNDGLLLLTFPSGPTESLSYRKNKNLRLHIRHFEFRDVQEIFAKRTGFEFKLLPWAVSHIDASLIGMWMVRYEKTSGQPVGEIDLERKVRTTIPYQRLSVCMITKNEEDHIVRCLKALADVADEIIIADTGSTDQTKQLASPYATTIFDTPYSPEGDGLGNFGAWRNASIAEAKGDWILWVDADEVLQDPYFIRRYLEGPLFNAYVLKQRHLMLDYKADDDLPMRLFRNYRGYQFFGAIHEHVEQGMDEQINPALVIPESYLAHYGYINERVRRAKCKDRNLALLKKDLALHPHRLLNKVLAARDYINFMHWEQERGNTLMNDEVRRWAMEACKVHRAYFTDVTSPHFKASFKNYQAALEALGRAGVPVTEDGKPPFEVGLILQGALGGIQTRQPLEPQYVWCWDRAEADEFLSRQNSRLLSKLGL